MKIIRTILLISILFTTNTVFASITNGAANSGYIPSDDAFQRYTFQVLSSSLEPNCAETSIINGLLEMIEE